MIKVGIIGGAGYTAGELIRLLINHPEVEIKFINSSSNAGNKITDVHEGLYGETDLVFTDELPLDEIDVLFFCTAHGDTKKFMESHNVPEDLKIIDLSMDYRIKSDDHDFIYGLPELNRRTICHSKHVANPGCFATCIQLGLLPLAKNLLLNDDVMVNAITGSTGAGVKPGATSHFSWRNNNMSVYKPFNHQHVPEIKQSLKQLQNSFNSEIDFIPYRLIRFTRSRPMPSSSSMATSLATRAFSSSSEKLEKGRRDQPPGRPAARSQTFMQAIMLPLLMPAKITWTACRCSLVARATSEALTAFQILI